MATADWSTSMHDTGREPRRTAAAKVLAAGEFVGSYER
jgi:hypothetical protein